jgi:hypothetical protein
MGSLYVNLYQWNGRYAKLDQQVEGEKRAFCARVHPAGHADGSSCRKRVSTLAGAAILVSLRARQYLQLE